MVGKVYKLKILDFVVQHGFRMQKKPTEYLASAFWHKFHEEYDVRTDLFQHMQRPAEPMAVNEIMLGHLSTAAHDNPSMRDAGPFVNHLRYLTEAMNLSEITVAVKNSLENERLTQERSVKMLMAIARHVGKFDIYLNEEAWWSSASNDFDQVIVKAWNLGIFSSGGRDRFLVTNRDALKPFLDGEALAKLRKTLVEKPEATPEVECVQKLMESQTGKVMFKVEGKRIERAQFELKADKSLKDVEYHQFSKDEVAAYFAIMRRSVDCLVQAGHAAFESKATVMVSWLTVEISCPNTGMQDRWTYPLVARAKQIELSNGGLLRLPWESLLFGAADAIADLPVSVRIPMDLDMMVEAANAREGCMKCFKAGATDLHLTFADMRKAVSPQKAALLEDDSCFSWSSTSSICTRSQWP